MDYLLSFFEGIITFISPCLLPMLPVYVSYFAGQRNEEKRRSPIINALGFVLGFTLVFIFMGAFAGTVGRFLRDYETALNIICGVIVIFFGLNLLEVVRIPFLSTNRQIPIKRLQTGFFASVIFGIIFSVSWTPCVGAFLGSALMLAASSGESVKGIFMLLCFSLGLGIPFLVSAVLIDKLKSAFDFIKKHYRLVNILSGGLLIVVGVLIATGLFGYFLSLLSI